MPADYSWEVAGEEVLRSEDFDERIDVIPVSDPNSSTMAQRIMQYQAALQLASTAPQLYNLSELHRQMLDVLGIQDADIIVPTDSDIKALDPVSENMNILKTDPVQAYMWQDHEAHIQVHMDASRDPKLQQIIQNSPNVKLIESSLSAHVLEHLGFQYRREIEKELGVTLPPPEEALPKDIEVRLSALVAEAGSRLLGRDQAEAQLQEQMKKMEDPVIQQQNREPDIKEAQLQSKMKTDAARIAADLKKAEERVEVDLKKIRSKEMLTGLEVGKDISIASKEDSQKSKERMSKDAVEGFKIGKEIGKDMREEGGK